MMKRILATVLCGLIMLASFNGCQSAKSVFSNVFQKPNASELKISEGKYGKFIENDGNYFLGTKEMIRDAINANLSDDLHIKIGEYLFDNNGNYFYYQSNEVENKMLFSVFLDDRNYLTRSVIVSFPYEDIGEQSRGKELRTAVYFKTFVYLFNSDPDEIMEPVAKALTPNQKYEVGKTISVAYKGIMYTLKVTEDTITLGVSPTTQNDGRKEESN